MENVIIVSPPPPTIPTSLVTVRPLPIPLLECRRIGCYANGGALSIRSDLSAKQVGEDPARGGIVGQHYSGGVATAIVPLEN